MPLEGIILNLFEYDIIEISGYKPVIVETKLKEDPICPHCSSKHLRNKGKFIRKLNHETIGRRTVKLHLQSCKFHCQDCKRYFNQRFPGIEPRRRNTEAFRQEVFQRHIDGTTQSKLASRVRISTTTVGNWTREVFQIKIKEKLVYKCPRILGIDEHFFGRKQGFATTFCDLQKHRIYDVTLGKSSYSLGDYLNRLEGKIQVKICCIDLCESYRRIIKRWFPFAKIVADRFHVVKLIKQHFLNYWKTLDPVGRKTIKLLRVMRKHRKNLTHQQQSTLDRQLNTQPVLKAAYELKEKLTKLILKKHVYKEHIPPMIKQFLEYIEILQKSPMYQLGATLQSWSEEIALMWRFSRNNGITEGFHNKMETISRRGYGYRNFENYRLRVRTLCS